MRTGTSYLKSFSKMMWLFALLLVVFTAGCDRDHGGAGTGAGAGPAGAVNLGTASTYGIIASDGITIDVAGLSHIYGDVALINNDSLSNFVGLVGNTSTNVTGVINTTARGDSAARLQAQADLNAAYLDLIGRAAPATVLTALPASAAGVNGGTFPAGGLDLGGFVLSPGIFTATGTYGLSATNGPLVLDAGGNSDAVFIIRSTSGASGLTSTDGSVVLRNGARATNVFWVVAQDATIGSAAGTFFQGTIVAANTITLTSVGNNVEGRMLAGALGAGTITLSNVTVIAVPAP